MNYRIFVEKKKEFQTETQSLYNELKENLGITLNGLRVINTYDLFDIDERIIEDVKKRVLSEIQTDLVYTEMDYKDNYLAVEMLGGQFDQRAYSADECIKLIDPNSKSRVKSGKLYIWDNQISLSETATLKKYLINSVESQEKDLTILSEENKPVTSSVKVIDGFIQYNKEELKALRKSLSLAMTDEDFMMVFDYFKSEKRNPTETEIRVLDTYWSDHCRHQTFETILDDITFEEGPLADEVRKTFFIYQSMKKALNKESKPVTLMDMATINGKYLRKNGYLDDMEVSEENNACSIFRDCLVDGKKEKYLIMFKNETHNHPTEIEPFGGASTCIGGAIRDPLSGRSYVYQALRVTGAGDITLPIDKTLEGKLPQRVISKGAASGYSSYGNQIGLATSYVREIFHEGYVAKRLEVGAVVGAVKAESIRRESPSAGDLIILLGGKTGRDGIGGATGSSKAHDKKSVSTLSSEVQKGNAPEERKLQRLFMNKDVIKLIKKANDFGAGGVSVAIGELADGLEVDLDKVPVKYSGLNGTEIAISESQERMAVVVEAKDASEFIEYAKMENLEANIVAKVTDNNRLVMNYKGKKILDISRDFISTNGAKGYAKALIKNNDINVYERRIKGDTFKEQLLNNLADPNVSEQKGLVEMFDSTIGAGTVLMPYGGKYQLTHEEVSASLVPGTDTATVMASGFNPDLSNKNPYLGAINAVLESISKVVSAGIDYQTIRFTFQEYFPRLGDSKELWGAVTESLLGSIYIQNELKLPSIGGKDSMSGTFNDLHVPYTLISFAISTMDAKDVLSNEFKNPGNKLYLIKQKRNSLGIPLTEDIKDNYDFIHKLILNKVVESANPITFGGLSEAICKASLGNRLGVNIMTDEDMFSLDYGSILIETKDTIDYKNAIYLGEVTNSDVVINEVRFTLDELIKTLYNRYENVYPTVKENKAFANLENKEQELNLTSPNKDIVKVFIPVFPGTNCDLDTKRAFEKEGAVTDLFVFRNTYEGDVEYSISEFVKRLDNADILVLSGGFSAGDEPDGSGKFIANVLNEKSVALAVERLIKRKGLILGICNGFQALVKSGLLPYGHLGLTTELSPTLFKNNINRHVSKIIKTKVCTTKSPWLNGFKNGEIHNVAVSHGEGKFVVNESLAKELFANGQVAFQYVDLDGNVTYDPTYNPNGSYYAIEGLISKDGLILGKMGHSERSGNNVFKNIYGSKNQNIFKNAINYFKKEN